MPPRIPDYVTTEDYSFNYDRYDSKVLPAGSFVKPIHLAYVPKHVLEREMWKAFDKKTEVFCYTKLGIMCIPKNLIREV